MGSIISRTMHRLAVSCVLAATFCSSLLHSLPDGQITSPRKHIEWSGRSHQDLHRECRNVFRHGNRNAASHLWSAFLLDRAAGMTHKELVHIFGGFCAVSGSPVNPHDYSRYLLRLDNVMGTGKEAGYMQYCCWPCVCDTQDFIRVDTKNVTTASGERQYRFAVIGNPCDHPEELDKPFQQSFGWGETTLRHDAPEVRCSDDGRLLGAHMSDHGYVILTMFFDDGDDFDKPGALVTAASGRVAVKAPQGEPTPGRVIKSPSGLTYQDEHEFSGMCESRKNAGYNSGMGEIFRKVAGISPIVLRSALPHLPSSQPDAEALNT